MKTREKLMEDQEIRDEMRMMGIYDDDPPPETKAKKAAKMAFLPITLTLMALCELLLLVVFGPIAVAYKIYEKVKA